MSAAPSWYDVLDVPQDASTDEVRAAWKSRIADLDPSDRRFRVCNQAAEVLLDPARRTAYDAELAAQADEEAQEEARQQDAQRDVEGEGVPAPRVPAPVAAPDAPERPVTSARPARRLVPAWLLVVLAVLTAAVLGTCAWLWVKVPSDAEVQDSTRAAQAAAERAAGPVLSYDAKDLDASKSAGESYLTSSFRKKYDQLFDGIVKTNAPSTGTVVKAQVIASAVVRSGADRVQVLLFVDQSRTNKKVETPDVFKNFVTVTMQKVGNDWLVDDMSTT
ncbi:MAG: J domain-containing protein [Nocardioides sp.]